MARSHDVPPSDGGRATVPLPRGSLPASDIGSVVGRVDAASPFVEIATTGGSATTWLSDVAAHVAVGADPLRPWRVALREQQQGTDAVTVPAHVPAAFVLQWWCEVVATPIAYAAELGPWVLAPEPAGLGFELAPALYPSRIVVLPERTRLWVEPHAGTRAVAARASYDALVADVVAGYAPEVRMGSRQRWGVVDDMWRAAVRRGAGAAGRVVGTEPVRTSCCFIFVLPGMHECASCPRGGPPLGTGRQA
ncbi:MAG: (2Fe-2S)-binding protein [Terracoccus sp.]